MKGEKRTTYEILRVSEGSIGMKTPERAVVLDSSFVCFALPLCLCFIMMDTLKDCDLVFHE